MQMEAVSDCFFRHAMVLGHLELGIVLSTGIIFIELHLLPQKEQKQSRIGSSVTATKSSMISLIHTLLETYSLFSRAYDYTHTIFGDSMLCFELKEPGG
jgi:hypothetical protein